MQIKPKSFVPFVLRQRILCLIRSCDRSMEKKFDVSELLCTDLKWTIFLCIWRGKHLYCYENFRFFFHVPTFVPFSTFLLVLSGEIRFDRRLWLLSVALLCLPLSRFVHDITVFLLVSRSKAPNTCFKGALYVYIDLTQHSTKNYTFSPAVACQYLWGVRGAFLCLVLFYL